MIFMEYAAEGMIQDEVNYARITRDIIAATRTHERPTATEIGGPGEMKEEWRVTSEIMMNGSVNENEKETDRDMRAVEAETRVLIHLVQGVGLRHQGLIVRGRGKEVLIPPALLSSLLRINRNQILRLPDSWLLRPIL